MLGKYGFPTEITDDPLIDLVLPAAETHPHAEERRLFHVAMTRARRAVYLLADRGAPSSFVQELTDGSYDITKVWTADGKRRVMPAMRYRASGAP